MLIVPRYRRPSLADEFFSNFLEDRLEAAPRFAQADLYETDHDVVVKLVVPGVNPDDVSLQVTGDVLNVTGESKREEETENGKYYQKEIVYGSFAQAITLPTAVEADRAEASFENGILKVTLPKSEDSKPKQIQIKGATQK